MHCIQKEQAMKEFRPAIRGGLPAHALVLALGLRVIAEGVEKVSQMEVLFNLGCHICQGFLFARPMPPAQVEQWLADTQSGLILPRVGTPPDGQELPPHTAL